MKQLLRLNQIRSTHATSAEATVRTRLFRARAMLRRALDSDVDRAIVDVYGFAGARCDRIVAAVLARVRHEP